MFHLFQYHHILILSVVDVETCTSCSSKQRRTHMFHCHEAALYSLRLEDETPQQKIWSSHGFIAHIQTSLGWRFQIRKPSQHTFEESMLRWPSIWEISKVCYQSIELAANDIYFHRRRWIQPDPNHRQEFADGSNALQWCQSLWSGHPIHRVHSNQLLTKGRRTVTKPRWA